MDRRCGIRAGSCVPLFPEFQEFLATGSRFVVGTNSALEILSPLAAAGANDQTDTEDLRKIMAKKDGAIEVEGRVVEPLPNAMFRIELELSLIHI